MPKTTPNLRNDLFYEGKFLSAFRVTLSFQLTVSSSSIVLSLKEPAGSWAPHPSLLI